MSVKLLLPVFVAVANFAAPGLAADVAVIEEIIAKVNGDIITRSEVDRSRRQMEAEMRQQGMNAQAIQKAVSEREPAILRDRIDQLLLVQKAKELSINVEGDISKQLAEYQRSMKLADPEKFQAAVREQTGMTFEDFKNEMRNSMLTDRVVRQEVGGKINISKAEIEKFYNDHKKGFVREEQVFLREILLVTEGKTPAQVAAIDKKAKDLVARARKGEKFAELAQDNSDAQSARQGGDLGGWKRGVLSKEIETLVFDKERGFVTDPLKVPNGFLILKVEEHVKSGQAQLEEVEQEITGKLYMPRFQPKIREYLTQLRQDAFLEIKPGWVDVGAAPGKDTAWKDPAQLKPETTTKEEVASRTRRKRLLWAVPIPGTKTSPKSSSKTTTMK
jgi:parvulin-like peptidyl-prolyl isomerase